jgi:DNA-binding transcriptional LysR family regulator
MRLSVIHLRMADVEPDWSLYRTFLAVARAGSFSAAARLTGSTQPTIGRQIQSLETTLGLKLFTRSQRGLLPTPAARELVAHAESMASAAAALQRASSGGASEQAGTVRLTAGEQVGLEVLPPILAEFSREHPRIELELSLSNRNEDLLRRDADIAVRMARPSQKALIARRIGSVNVGLFAHRSYVEAHGLPREPSDFSHHRLIGFDRDMHILRTTGGAAARLRREDFAIRTDSIAAQIAMLRAGLGITACQVNVARRDPNLVPVLAKDMSFQREVWLVTHPDLKGVRRIRWLFDHLARRLKQYVDHKGG